MGKNNSAGTIWENPAFHGDRFASRIEAFSWLKSHQCTGPGSTPTRGRLGRVRNFPWSTKELMLDGSRPTKIFGVTTKAENLVLIENQHAPGRGILASLVVSIVPTRKILSKYPVSPVKIRVIEKSHRSKKMGSLALLGSTLGCRISRNRTYLETVSGFLVDFLGAKISMLAVTAENIRKPNLHLESLKSILDIITSFRVSMIHEALHQLSSGLHVKLEITQSVIEKC